MALIKQSSAHALTRDAIVLDLGDLQRQAAAIVAGARIEADRIAAAARAERERIVAGAAEEGRAKGYEAGRVAGHTAGVEQGRAAAAAEFKDRFAKLEAAWTEAFNSFESRREEFLRSAQTDVLRLALAIAERITKRLIDSDPQVAAAQLEALLGVIVRRTQLVVRINPADRDVLQAGLPQLLARFSQVRHIELVDDPSLARGSCIADVREPEYDGSGGGASRTLRSGEIDASISTQMDRIVQALLPSRVEETPDAAAEPSVPPASESGGAAP